MKILLQKHIGLALGLHNFVPSYGIRIDLWVIKFGVTRYTRELTNVIGEQRRDITMGYLSLGW